MTKARDLANAANALDDVSATELGYLDGVTSAIQTQIDAKQAVVSGVNDTELGYLDGVTSAIQTQLDAKTAKSTLTTTGDIYYASSANTPARLGIGSTSQVLTVSGGVPSWATPAATGSTVAVFADNKTTNTSGGTFTNGAWRTRDLQTTYFNNITSCSLASNQITLPAGTYEVTASAPSFQVDASIARLYNITDSAVVGDNGSTAYSAAADTTISPAILVTAFTITGTKVFELQHRCETTKATNGLGVSVTFGGDEVYSQIKIVKVA
jgi:hypothetical protein